MQGEKAQWKIVILDDLQDELLAKCVSFLSSFVPEGGDPVWSAESFRWKLQRNPAGLGFMLCVVLGDDVVGTNSITLKRVWCGGRELLAGEAGDIYVSPKVRPTKRARSQPDEGPDLRSAKDAYIEKSLSGKLRHEDTVRALKSGVDLIYGTPNQAAMPGWLRLGYGVHPVEQTSLIRPTAKALESARGLRFLFDNPVGRVLSAVLTGAERCVESVHYWYWVLFGKVKGYQIEELDGPTEELDALWEKCKDQAPFSLIRDRAYFRHRFFENPIGNYRVFRTLKNGDICGVMVTRTKRVASGKKYCYIADWLLECTHPGLCQVMLAHAIHNNYATDVSGFVTWTNELLPYLRVFRKFGFIRSSAKVPVIFYPTRIGKELLDDRIVMDFTMASSDNI